jgi:hypothetical protein
MSHLSPETIARLVDETPAAQEAIHLSVCTVCAHELSALQEQTRGLAALGEIRPGRGSWLALEKRLERERLVAAPVQQPVRRGSAVFLRLAASIAIFAIGAASGAALRTTHLSQPDTGLTPAAQPVAVLEPVTPTVISGQPDVQPREMSPGSAARAVAPSIRPSAATVSGRSDPVTDVQLAEAAYLRALARFTEAAPSSGTDPVARLAALESILMTTQAALQEAPADPVINGYHLTALAQRDAVLRQIAVQPALVRSPANSPHTWF